MANSLSFTGTDIKVFPCPNCRETINTTMRQCSFCSAPIDIAAAELSAAATSRISHACSDASYLKIMLSTLAVFALLTFFPLLGLVGLAGFVFIKLAFPVMAVRWWIKYGRIETTDPDFSKARNAAAFASVVWLLIFFIVRVNFFGIRI